MAKDMKMTPELEEQLKRYRGYLPQQTIKWTPPVFKCLPPKEWPVFEYRTRMASDCAQASDMTSFTWGNNGEARVNSGSTIIAVVKAQTVNWENYKDRNGKEIKCELDENKKVKDDCLDKVSFELLKDYAEAIKDESCLTDEEIRGLKS